MSQHPYFGFFSTYTGQVTSDPRQMVIPIDDHGFHRGDGVFEAIKWIDEKIWLLDPHLHRLEKSAARIGLKLPLDIAEIKKKVTELVTMAAKPRGLIRVFATRGPGSFGVSPYECTGAQVYIVLTELKEWSEDRVLKGASLRRSAIVPKLGMFAQVKSLNYLPNVLMKKEALDSGYDFAFGVAPTGEILESSTENLAFLKGDQLITPPFDSILRGTSLLRLTEIIPKEMGLLWVQRQFSYEELVQSEEVFLVGTTIDVLPVSRIDDHAKATNRRTLSLRRLLQEDQK